MKKFTLCFSLTESNKKKLLKIAGTKSAGEVLDQVICNGGLEDVCKAITTRYEASEVAPEALIKTSALVKEKTLDNLNKLTDRTGLPKTLVIQLLIEGAEV